MSEPTTDTPPIVLIHGLWMTSRSWDRWAEGVRVNPPSQIKALFPILSKPSTRHRAVGFTKEQFHYAFANTCTREESDAAYDQLHIPAPGTRQPAAGSGLTD
ncbi:lipase family protein [Saccharomonospora azurea]|uniref:hypothetical protein n=1 Tax=Saccharomonospora azurea TaxID=40988 RepID=UPI00022DFDCF|nr:hypothetical protein [Saccharomonospora azurea]